MRRKFFVFVALLSLLFVPFSSQADDPPVPTEGLVVDVRWIDIIRDDDRQTLEVIEHNFFNNTGLDTFNGTIYSWVPEGAVIRSECCGNVLDMACRLRDEGFMTCFGITHVDENIVSGVPFEQASFLSYFSQEGTITLTGTSQNYSYSDSLALDVSLGSSTAWSEFPPVSGQAINITTNVEEIGVIAHVQPAQPEKLGLYLDIINITNNAPNNDTIDLEIEGLPEGWSGLLLADGKRVENVSVPSNESRLVTLHMQMPSYIMEVQLHYFLSLKGYNDPKGEYLFQKDFLYNNSELEIFAFLLRDDDLSFGSDLNLEHDEWIADQGRMWYIVNGTDILAGDATSMQIAWENVVDYSFLILVAVVLALAGLTVFLVLRKKRAPGPKEAEPRKPEERAAFDESSELEAKKQKLLKAIKRLKQDYEAGDIPQDVYEELLAQYKGNVIDIMKRIDGVK